MTEKNSPARVSGAGVPDPDTLVRLIARLDAYPVGLPDTPDVRELLALFLSAEEAELAAVFPLCESTPGELARRVKWPKERVERVLEALGEKGAALDFPLGGKTYWLLTPSVVGLVEFSLMKLHAGIPLERIARILERCHDEERFWNEVFGSKTPLARTLVGADIPVTSRVATYAQVEKVVRAAGYGAVQTCYCRHKEQLLGRSCRLASHEGTCMSLGRAADFVVRRGFGRRAEADELLALIRSLGEKGLIHVTDNVREEPSFICNCCGCCCGFLTGVRKGLPHALHPSPVLARVDEERCAACGACAKLCQIGAVRAEKGAKARVNDGLCLGCGACLRACRKDALSLVERTRAPHVPKNAATKFVRMAWEKGRFWNIVRDNLRVRAGRLLRRDG
ncbi:MAG: 4Fe-4S binding protein [Elusimicrobiota bacterium]|jgi:Pyruvate/2-oxoacid:ferredoxin oxidoreductase delta subunit